MFRFCKAVLAFFVKGHRCVGSRLRGFVMAEVGHERRLVFTLKEREESAFGEDTDQVSVVHSLLVLLL